MPLTTMRTNPYLPRIIQPHVGITPFHFGLTREELWALTDSTIESYIHHRSPQDLSDAFIAHGITTHYRQKYVYCFFTFTKVANKVLPLLLYDHDIANFSRQDLLALLELLNLNWQNNADLIIIANLGLTFGFYDHHATAEYLDFVCLEICN